MSEPIEGVSDDGDPTSSLVVTSHAVQSETETPQPEPAATESDESEGGEQPSATQETAEPAGTDSSESSSPDGKYTESSGNETPSPVPTAANLSDPVARTESSSAGSTDGSGTDL